MTTVPDDITGRRARLAALDATLARLRARYDVLMNAFKFDAARGLVPEIEATERERTALAAALPPVPEAEPKPYVVMQRRRRR
ncbi:MAG TPA: hypothetical protein VG651_09875 [Stellaceae bacterium]|nr:hypothetical protein [Stellaceae bacterium]